MASLVEPVANAASAVKSMVGSAATSVSKSLRGMTDTDQSQPQVSAVYQSRVYVVFCWFDNFLGKQLGIYRIATLAKDAFEFLEKAIVFVGIAAKNFAGKTWSGVVFVFSAMRDGTCVPHAFNTLKFNVIDPLRRGELGWDNVAKTVKNVTDVVASVMFVAITFAGKMVLLAPAKVLILIGDIADIQVESDDYRAACAKAANDGKLLLEKDRTAHMLKMVKIVCGVACGVIFAMQLGAALLAAQGIVLSAYLPTVLGSVFTVEVVGMISATLSIVGSICAVVAEYKKSDYALETDDKNNPVAKENAKIAPRSDEPERISH